MNRAPFQPPPPPAPPASAAPPAGRPARPIRETLTLLGAFTGCMLAASAWAWLWLAVLPVSLYPCLCLGLPGGACLLAACGVLAVPLLDDAAAAGQGWQARRQDLILRWQTGQSQLDALEAHVAHVYGPRGVTERTVVINTGGAPAKARLRPTDAAPRPTDAATQRLPALPDPPPAVAYRDTPLEVVVLALASGAPCSVRQRPGGLSRPTFEAAISRLIAAGVVSQERGKPPTLTPPFARLTTTPHYLQHQVQRALNASEE